MKPFTWKIIVLAVCLLLSVFSFRGTLEPVANAFGGSALKAHNQEYLDSTLKRALVGFGVMSSIKAGLAVIEGSTAGVVINLQVGDIVQSVYDYIDIAWRTMLIGCVTILSMQYLLEAAEITSKYVLSFVFAVLGLSLALRWWGGRCRQAKYFAHNVLSFSVVLALAVVYLLPLSVWGASHLSQKITQPKVLAAQAVFVEADEQLLPEDRENYEGPLKRLSEKRASLEKMWSFFSSKSSEIALATIKLIAGYIFDCIVFPLAVFILLLWLTLAVMRYFFQMNLQSSLRDDLRGALVGDK